MKLTKNEEEKTSHFIKTENKQKGWGTSMRNKQVNMPR